MIAKKNVVVIGGGTGTYTILEGLRQYADRVEITAVVTMADSGGSSGRLRDEFGQLPVGDVRQALAALAPGVAGEPNILRQLFLYRFSRGEGLSGHNLGNLFLTALTDILGSEDKAIKAASQLLRVAGTVLPVTTTKTDLSAAYQSGRVVVGEHAIDVCDSVYHADQITQLSLTTEAVINPDVLGVLATADLIVLGPGDLYTSIIANLLVKGIPEVLQSALGKIVFVGNLMERAGQTVGITGSEYIEILTSYIGRQPDVVLVPSAALPKTLTARYWDEEKTKPVPWDEVSPELLCPADIVSDVLVPAVPGDVTPRSLIRHDSAKLATAIVHLLHRD